MAVIHAPGQTSLRDSAVADAVTAACRRPSLCRKTFGGGAFGIYIHRVALSISSSLV